MNKCLREKMNKLKDRKCTPKDCSKCVHYEPGVPHSECFKCEIFREVYEKERQ